MHASTRMPPGRAKDVPSAAYRGKEVELRGKVVEWTDEKVEWIVKVVKEVE